MSKPKQESRFEYKGFTCVVLMQPMGFRTGYVALPKGHKFYQKNYLHLNISCHGGLTYSENYLATCEDRDVWWIGFDCAHYGDSNDYDTAKKLFEDDEETIKSLKYYEETSIAFNLHSCGSIKTLKYCENECKSIVDQIIGG